MRKTILIIITLFLLPLALHARQNGTSPSAPPENVLIMKAAPVLAQALEGRIDNLEKAVTKINRQLGKTIKSSSVNNAVEYRLKELQKKTTDLERRIRQLERLERRIRSLQRKR